MCGIGGVISLGAEPVPELEASLGAINELQRHRGPDGSGTWISEDRRVGFAHRRLSIIDLETGQQPMQDAYGSSVTSNGEIYNYLELRKELGLRRFRTTSDTEVVLHGFSDWGVGVLERLRGMFAFAYWDAKHETLFCARDRFGIKPFYYTTNRGSLYFASEAKALLPFVSSIELDYDALREYLSFQFCLDSKTLFKDIRELPPGHLLTVRSGSVRVERYWDVVFEHDYEHTEQYFARRLAELTEESVDLHLRSDVPVGAYLSGGLDSSIVTSLASARSGGVDAFVGRFDRTEFDETRFARAVAAARGVDLHEVTIGASDFVDSIERVIYHLDYPVAGPGSFPQYHVSELASKHRKVLLGGQGGDEIFGGYTRYLIAYFEQCLKGAIDGTMDRGDFVVTYESIIPNLSALRSYKPLLQEFWREGLFEPLDRRYYRLINRAPDLGPEISWDVFGDYSPFGAFSAVFSGDNVGPTSYFDKMTHFDFKTLLPALLHVEDRMSMAHGLESRVPLLDHRIVELAATMPATVKFRNGEMKHILKRAFRGLLPESVENRPDKMGFPVPLHEWLREPGEVRDFVFDILGSSRATGRDFVDNRAVLGLLDSEPRFGRKIWGLLSLELWQRAFLDRRDAFTLRASESVAV